MRALSYRHPSLARPPSRLDLVYDEPDELPRDASVRLLRQMLRRGSGYGIAGPTWREGKRQRPAARPRDVKSAVRKLVKRLYRYAAGDPELLRIAAEVNDYDRRHRCLDLAIPQCGQAAGRRSGRPGSERSARYSAADRRITEGFPGGGRRFQAEWYEVRNHSPFSFSEPKHQRGCIDRAAPGVYRVGPSRVSEPTPRGAELGTTHRKRHLYAVARLALASARAQAEGFVAERVFPVTGACYGRIYDRAHLSRHPGQVVAGITLSGSSRTLIADRRLRDRIVPELALTLRVVFADGAVAQGDVGCAEEAGRVARCGRTASCGGDVAVEALPDGRLRLVNDDVSGRAAGGIAARPGFSPEGGCPPAGQEGRFVPPDGENRVFVLAPLPAVACAGVNAR